MKVLQKLGIIFVVMLTTFLFLFEGSALASKEPYMKSSKVRWNLKPDKTITFKTYYSGYGYMDVKATVKDFVIKNAKKKGYKKLSFYIDYQLPQLKLTKKQIKKIFDARNQLLYMWTILDYKTGTSLEVENDFGVKVSYKPWEYSEDTYMYSVDSDTKIGYAKSAKKEVSVIYPEDFDRMCLMIGGSTDPSYEGSLFWDGDIPLRKTPFYKKDKKDLSSFMRIKDMK